VLTAFVNTIHEGAQFVHVTVGNLRHAFIVNIDVTLDKIMICDWYGKDALAFTSPAWKEYQDFLEKLQEKNGGVDIEYYEVDEKIKEEAKKCAERNHGFGGCVDYAHRWFDAHSDEMNLPV